ncbi:MAG TPA: hypothetical protein VGC89_13960 [Pyrinomonadaceae bacterium]
MSGELEREKEAPAEADFAQTRGILWLWVGVLTAPLAFLLSLQIDYYLVYKLCPNGRMLTLHLVTAAFLLLAAGGGFAAWRNWQEAGRKWPGEEGSVTERSRFMAVVGLLMSAIFVLLMIAILIPQFIFHPCQR